MSEPTYKARTAYQHSEAAQEYEDIRFHGWLGRARWRAERAAVRAALDGLPAAASMLDCPCGIGRWAEILAGSARHIIGFDISVPMLERARREQATRFPL
ncbi:MAG TPA: class I SAM-dependent methyltransferase, partial [Gemmatimonadales bacterium]|nr:class I SAM-dependent methyltransferase [Gemmatimonadales bacterium]